jgi:4-diphosphocytidyl-2-C-methyl-D-erythritol kinase
MQAGLGGGSSDAAATLRVLAKRWRVGDAKVRAEAAALGADVPYFLEGGTALGLERGDLLFPLREPASAWVVLVIPAFGVSTRDAFGWFDAAKHAGGLAPIKGGSSWKAASGDPAASEMVNDLEAPVAAHHPEIARIISALRGSGSAVFGLFSSRQPAAAAAARLSARSFRTLLTRTLNRQTYQRLAAT